MSRVSKFILIFSIIIILLFIANLFFGSVSIPKGAILNILLDCYAPKNFAWNYIILESRLPLAITALFTGGALAVAGLLLQTVFRNPLADSGILGISSGANLGAALVILLIGSGTSIGQFNISYSLEIVFGAFIGAAIILVIIMGFSSVIKNNIMLLIIGIMVGYLVSSIIAILNFSSTSEKVYSFMVWGMGDFSGVSYNQLPFYCAVIFIGLIIAFALVKPLNAILLGDRYASNLGINIKLVRFFLLFCAGLLTAVTCAFCGPIAFIGLAVPHIARLLLKTSNHKSLLISTLMIGASLALICNLISVIPGNSNILPLNAITPIFGAPVIIYVIINQKRIQYFS